MDDNEEFDDLTTQEIEDALVRLYLKGLIKIEYDENLEAVFSINEELLDGTDET